MQKPLRIAAFTPSNILNGVFRDVFPEYYKLQDVVESQAWHNNQTVFDHSIKSAVALEDIVRFDYLQPRDQEKFTSYLAGKYASHSRLDLLRLAILLHDIGKLTSLQRNAQGDTSSPSHSLIGSWAARPIVDAFAISDEEKETVLRLVSDHLVASDLIEMSVNNNTAYDEIVRLLQLHRPDSAVELLLLAYADWLGCDIRETVRQERNSRVAIVHACLSLIAR